MKISNQKFDEKRVKKLKISKLGKNFLTIYRKGKKNQAGNAKKSLSSLFDGEKDSFLKMSKIAGSQFNYSQKKKQKMKKRRKRKLSEDEESASNLELISEDDDEELGPIDYSKAAGFLHISDMPQTFYLPKFVQIAKLSNFKIEAISAKEYEKIQQIIQMHQQPFKNIN